MTYIISHEAQGARSGNLKGANHSSLLIGRLKFGGKFVSCKNRNNFAYL